MVSSRKSVLWLATAGVALGYFALGRVSLLLAIPPGYATAVWPPAGLALAAILLGGGRLWAGVWLGSFGVNVATSFDGSTAAAAAASLLVAVAIASGAAIQAVVGARLVRRRSTGELTLATDAEVIRFLLHGGLLACLCSPCIGVGALWLAGLVHEEQVLYSWVTWWVGDAIGAFTVAPLVLMWGARPLDLWRQRRASVGVPLVAALVVVVAAFVYGAAAELSAIRSDFERRSEAMVAAIDREFADAAADLLSVAAFFQASDEVTAAEFATFVGHLLRGRPGLRSLSWVPEVVADELPAFIARARRDVPRFLVWEEPHGMPVAADGRPRVHPVLFIAPIDGNEAALGFDIGSEPIRAAAIERARAGGQLAATAPLRLVQATDERPGLLLLQPVVLPGGARGMVNGVLRHEDLLRPAVTGIDPAELRLAVRDQDADRSVFAFGTGGEVGRAEFAVSLPLHAGGRTFVLDISASRLFVERRRPLQSWAVLVGGVLFAGLLGMVLLVVTGRTAVVEARVRARTADLRDANDKLALAVAQHQCSESMLRSSQDELEAAQQQARLGSWKLDLERGVGTWSTQMFRMFGLPAEAGAPPFARFLTSLHPDDRDLCRDTARRVAETGVAAAHDLRTDPASGPMRVFAATVQREIDPVTGVARLTGTLQEVTAQRHAEAAVRTSLREKEVLLQEIHHRVKNNLQVVTSLLSLQAAQIAVPEVAQQLRQSQHRVRTMALIHETLYRSGDLARIDLSVHLRDLSAHLLRAHEIDRDRVRIDLDVAAVTLELARAVPFGLLINELLTNALRHAFPAPRTGRVAIVLLAGPDDHCEVSVVDDGIGMPSAAAPGSRSLGLQLVQTLTRQLGGELRQERGNPTGTVFRLRFLLRQHETVA
ncbi:MAG: CHASE domain-containing protein [Planctomycetes bacterium]|nr:CHASE domain-containing protein [Planctomycetota bacterium]